MKYFFFLIFLQINLAGALIGQDDFKGYDNLFSAPLQHTAYRSVDSMIIDGNLLEPSWNKVPWSADFIDIEGDKKRAPTYQTRFKILWDNQYMYIGAELQEPHVWAYIKDRDAIIYHDNDFEVFLDPDGDTHNYFEIEVNAFNTIFDLFMTRPYRNGGLALINWNAAGLKSGVSVKGTINRSGDTDKSWFVEMAIPFKSVSIGNNVQVPKDGTNWRINFSRVQWDTDISGGKYIKRVDSNTKRPLPEHNWVWSPQGVINMHFPERWGYLQFSTEQAIDAKSSKPRTLPAEEKLKQYLWLLYYKQHAYRHQHKKFANSVQDLEVTEKINAGSGDYNLRIESTSLQFTAFLEPSATNDGWQINQEGKISKYFKQ